MRRNRELFAWLEELPPDAMTADPLTVGNIHRSIAELHDEIADLIAAEMIETAAESAPTEDLKV